MERNKNGELMYKGYRVKPLGTFSMYYISPPGSGNVPDSLTGNFTNLREVMIAIDRQLESLKGRGRRKDGKGENTSTN